MDGAVYLEDHLPRGFCAECCSRMAKGELYQGTELRAGGTLVSAYCPHHECGGTILVEPGRPQRWMLTVPIDRLVWDDFVLMRAAGYDGMRAGRKKGTH